MTGSAGDAAYRFDDGAAYERFMGRWSRGAGEVFLEWLAPAPGACWLDVGCGTGSFTELIVDRCAPSAVSAIDPERAQIDHASNRPVGRVARSGAIVGAYVWDFAAELSPTWPMRLGLRELGVAIAPTPGAENSRLSALKTSFEHAGLKDVTTRSIDVTSRFSDFEDFWISQTPAFNPIARKIAELAMNDRTRLIEAVRAKVLRPDGSVEYVARANAVGGRAPG